MSLKVVVHSAKNLPDVDFKGKSDHDPFAVLSFRGRKKKTPAQKETLDPTWPPKDATFDWPLGSAHLADNEKLLIKVKDYEKVWFKRLLGQVEIPLRDVRKTKKVDKRAYELHDGKHRPILDATISLEIEYVPPGDTADGRVSQKQEETKESPEDKRDDDHEDYVDERESDEDDDDEEASRKGKEKRSRVPEKKRIRRRLRRQWSDKTKDFQIRIQILEGRHLPGSDIHPLVRVAVAGQRQHTNAAHSTNRPIYNKMLHFNFHGSSEAELFDQPIILEVFNSRGTFRSNALLGFFKFDIGYVYERKGHCFINKWIMLSEPDGKKDEKYAVTQKTRSARSPAGYLKVSAVVLGPGDKLPVGVDATSQHDRDEDIDANCLMPVGVQRQSALFVLKVYQAKDLPQMDTGVVMKFKSFFARLASWSEDKEEGVKEKDRATQDLHEEKNLVDPYLTFSFGGKEVSTDVIYNKSEPQFNQVLRIPFMFPSMCERLKLQLMDWDQGSRHDHIGAAFLSLSSISGPGEVNGGFFPQFGPCFINFYGSPREYHQMPDKYDYLNKGIGEGVAYRGRVLVELKTMPTHSSVTQPDRISWAKKDTVRFESYKRLSNFTLFACFHEASMVAVTDRPVEFELSIGNKGTKFDESVAHSNTTPCKAIPAGFHYHYLPWGREKPCVWIESQWEDIAFRIEPLNVLNRMRESLEKELEELKVLKDDQQGLERMRSVFKGFSKTCSDLLTYFRDVVPTLSGLTNSLDEGIHSLRKNELNYLIEDSKAFYNKPESERKKENVTAEIRNYIRRIKSMAMEPQLSMPDVILWMMSGDKRVAYYRIPAHDLLFSNNVDACGKLCGKIVELPLKYPRREGADEHLEIPALVRMELWLGLRRHQQQWINRGDDYGEFRVFAEKYENQKRKSKTEWKPSTSPNWPNYSDAAGELKLPKDSFAKPDGWEFFGDPNVSAISTLRQPDENLTEFRDEMYEHERRKFPGGDWEPGKPRYTDTYGEETTLPIDPPTGWTAVAAPGAVNGGWTVDRNRAVDEDGWEYSPHRTYVDFGPEEKAFHLSRRKRLTRLRKRKPGEQIHKDPPPTDGWEYSRSLHESFHPEEKSTDCLRRRRLLHQIVPSAERTKEGGIKFPIFKVLVQGKKGKESALCVLPRMFVTYKCAMKCQLWVSIYQARGLISQDKTGKNDPYVRVSFVNKSQETKTLPQTLCPTWDQTLIFEDVDIYGNPGDLAKCPPSVVMELFDHDKGKHDFLGRCRIKPKVLVKENERPNRELTWRKVHRGEQDGGQILVECELFLTEVVNLPARPKKRGDVYPICDELRPKTQRKAIEILSWGVRDLKGNKSVMIPKPSVEFELNQEIIKSDEVIGDMKACPNFCFPVLKRTILELPENDEYAPPLNILVYDNNWFGKSLLGLCEIPSMKAFEVKPESQSVLDGQLSDGKRKQSAKKRGKSQEDLLKDKEEFDWWSKYHASKDPKAKDRTSSSVDGGVTKTHTEKYLEREYDTLTIYPDKLENQPEFQGFNDFITTFPLRRGKTKTTKDGDTVVGKFKGAFRVINNPDEHDLVHSMAKMQLPSNDPVNCIVRVYVVRATQLQPKDADGLADPYLIASLGEKTQGQPSEHIAKTLKPIFGR